jgi:hypothetical protein
MDSPRSPGRRRAVRAVVARALVRLDPSGHGRREAGADAEDRPAVVALPPAGFGHAPAAPRAGDRGASGVGA